MDPDFEKGRNMFSDLQTSRDTVEKYREEYPEDDIINVVVITAAMWPTYETKPVTLPYDLQSSLDQFTKFYAKLQPKKPLTWIHSLATVTLTARFPKGDKALTVSLYQALVLLLFNDGVDTLKFREIRERTDLGMTCPVLALP